MMINLNGTFISGEAAELPVNDGGFLFGDTLFETLKARNQRILLQKEHLDRLEASARRLDFPCDRRRIENALQQLAPRLSSDTSRIRLTISRGSFQSLDFPPQEDGWFLLTAVPYQELTPEQRQAGASCMTAPNRRVNPTDHLPQMKRGNYADCLYAHQYARRQGAREAIFTDAEDNLLEGATSNLFAVIGGRLCTPTVGDLILDGIMRQQVISTAAELGIPVAEGALSRSDFSQADEAFLTNSLVDILPINALDGRPLKRGDSWKRLLNVLQMRIGY